MFKCDRCGSSFNPIRVASSHNCPRCRARDRVDAPLTLQLFESEIDGDPEAGKAPRQGGDEACRGSESR